jgi:hypothetical protein
MFMGINANKYVRKRIVNMSDKKTNEELDAQFGDQTNIQLEKQYSDIERELRLMDLELKREAVKQLRQAKQAEIDKAAAQQAAISQFLVQRRLRQANCSHRKGGSGADAVIRGQGTSAMSCVIKHLLPAGNYLVLCQRCGREWHGPLSALQNGGTARPATKGYFAALQLTTNNTSSGSSRFDFSVAQPVFEGDGDEEGDE